MDLPILSYWAAVALLVLSVLGFVLLAVVLVRSGMRRGRSATHPLPYPGCRACLTALSSDGQDFTTGALEYHQVRHHPAGARWW